MRTRPNQTLPLWMVTTLAAAMVLSACGGSGESTSEEAGVEGGTSQTGSTVEDNAEVQSSDEDTSGADGQAVDAGEQGDAEEYSFEEGYPIATEQLQPLMELLGGWQGQGARFADADSDGESWTGNVIYEKAYGDHFLQKREILELSDGSELATLAFTGWDWDNDRYNQMSINNANEGGQFDRLHVRGDGTFLVVRSGVDDQGRSVVDETVTEPGADTYTVVSTRSLNGGPPFVTFDGVFNRSDAVTAETIDLSSPGPALPLSDESKWIAPMAGEYIQVGSFGGDPVEGVEFIDLDLGGHAVFINFDFPAASGPRYFGASVTGWNPTESRFTGFLIANDGTSAPFEAHISETGDELVYLSNNNVGGIPTLDRWIALIDQEEGLKSVTSVTLSGTAPAGEALTITFTPVDE